VTSSFLVSLSLETRFNALDSKNACSSYPVMTMKVKIMAGTNIERLNDCHYLCLRDLPSGKAKSIQFNRHFMYWKC